MKEVFKMRKINHITGDMYKLNLNVPRRNHVTFSTKSLSFMDSSITLNITTEKTLMLSKS